MFPSYVVIGYFLKHLLLIAVLLLLVWVVLDFFFGVGAPKKISGMRSFNNFNFPIVGNLFTVLDNPALVYMKWSKEHGCSIFQLRLGNKRAIVVNSYEDCKNLLHKFASSTNSRPIQYIFHNIVSETQGFTIGSTPLSDTYKRKKKMISMNINQKNVESYANLIDIESFATIRQIILTNLELHCFPSCVCPRCNIKTKISDISLMSYAQLFVLKVAVSLSYGLNLDSFNIDRKLCEEIIEVESEIIKLRAPAANLEDFIPILRWKPFLYFNQTSNASHFRGRRDKYMNSLMDNLNSRLDSNQPSALNSIVGKVVSHKGCTLTTSEIQSVCLTLISAGLDNTPLNFNHLMGHLSQPSYGASLQRKAFENITTQYDGDMIRAWKSAPYEMNCTYILALIYETFRYFTVLPLNLPRQTTKDILYKGMLIPKDSTIFFNSYAANHDPMRFIDPIKFDPDRWLISPDPPLRINQSVNHFSFGDGSRKCPGNLLAIKELYALTCRMIILFKIKPPTLSTNLMELDPFKENKFPRATSFEPGEFKLKLEKRCFMNADSLYYNVLSG